MDKTAFNAIMLTLELTICALLTVFGVKLRSRFKLIDKQFNQLSTLADSLRGKIEEASLEAQNAVSLSGANFKFPVFFGKYSIDSFLGRFLMQYLITNSPKVILELGTGSSTLLIARTMQLLKTENYEHFAVDHDSRYLEQTRKMANLNDLSQFISFWLCPLEHIDTMDKLWYTNLTDRLKNNKIDLLLVDGPPGDLQECSRYPALPLLHPFLNERCTIILHDTSRREERAIAEKWAKEFAGLSLEFINEGAGTAILTR